MAKNKDAYYFRHDSNARFDQKILKLRSEFGWEGYGIYWAIIEAMRDNSDYKLHISDIKSLSFSLHIKFEFLEEFFKKCVEDFSLFILKDSKYYSKRLLIDMKHKERVSNIRSANAKQKQNKNSAKNSIKENKIRVEKIRGYIGVPETNDNLYEREVLFNFAWELYPKKDGRKQALKSFKCSVDTEADFENLIKAIGNYKQSNSFKQGFVKNGSTFFNNWQDWIKPHSNGGAANEDLEPEKF